MVANEDWRELFPKAEVHHVSMSASDHCLLALFLRHRTSPRPLKRRFFFEAIWTRDERCKEVIERAWDPFKGGSKFQIQDRIKSCQFQLQKWNREVYGNVSKNLKNKQRRLQQLEALNMLHETAGEIIELRKEINETLNREELMWNQRSRALWMKYGDHNTQFFHATATQR